MYWYEKDYIMRLIHGISRVLARMIFGEDIERDDELIAIMENGVRENNDYLRNLVDNGRINDAEDRLFELIENTAWDDRQKAALAIAFYDYVNEKDDEFLAAADFSRDEVAEGLVEALKIANIEVPEYLKIN